MNPRVLAALQVARDRLPPSYADEVVRTAAASLLLGTSSQPPVTIWRSALANGHRQDCHGVVLPPERLSELAAALDDAWGAP